MGTYADIAKKEQPTPQAAKETVLSSWEEYEKEIAEYLYKRKSNIVSVPPASHEKAIEILDNNNYIISGLYSSFEDVFKEYGFFYTSTYSGFCDMLFQNIMLIHNPTESDDENGEHDDA